MMLATSIFLVFVCTDLSHGVLYDHYTGKPVSDELLDFYEQNGVKDTCTVDIQPCNRNDWSRADGTCNNVNFPAWGSYFSPLKRILPAVFHNRYEQRKAESGEELPLARTVRLNLLKQQKSSHKLLNNLVPGYYAFVYTDIGSIHDNQNMLGKTNYCCEKEHMNDYECTPNIILPDDPVHKYTDVRCMNSTRPLTYQDFKCTKDAVPSPIKKATTPFDCSQIYNANGKGDKILRSYEGGQLAVEEEYGTTFPPNGPTASCPTNVKPSETRCPENYFATLLPVSLLSVWFVRNHNEIAKQLAELNPCWSDDLLYETARDINIATYNQIHVYEWNTAVQGHDNLVKAGIITKENLFRDIWDEKKECEVTLEFTFIIRFFHLMQESRTMLYDSNGKFIEEFKTFDASFRMGLLAQNMESFTQSMFRAGCHGGDGSVDYDLANYALPGFQKSIDATAGDINKNRHFNIAPYIDYVRYLHGVEINTFDDLKTHGLMTDEKILLLNSTYGHVRDIDLIAGTWCESNMEGGNIPLTTAKIINDNLFRAIQSNSHWYERKDRAHAFTEEQLKEIRKASMALLLCSVGDGVREITKNAFLTISEENPLVPCSEITKIDYSAWADDECNANSYAE